MDKMLALCAAWKRKDPRDAQEAELVLYIYVYICIYIYVYVYAQPLQCRLLCPAVRVCVPNVFLMCS
jgi:hypothetical protein